MRFEWDEDKNSTSKHPQTDWQKLEAMTDEEIDYSDIPPLDDDFLHALRYGCLSSRKKY